MGLLVAAMAASHVPLMETHFENAPAEKAQRVVAGFERLRMELEIMRPDALVIIAADHFRTFFMDLMPSFCIGIGAVSQGWGDWSLPRYELDVAQDLAHSILSEATEAGFDPAFSLSMPLDHGFVMPLHHLKPASDIPIVPIFVNCAGPPLPSLRRCCQLGRVIAKTIERRPADERIAVLASGGLSHWVPFPKPSHIKTDFDKLMWDLMLHGKGRVDDPETTQRRMEGVEHFIANSPRVNEKFDRAFLDLFAAGEEDGLTEYSYDYIDENGGNGGQEIRTWMTLMGAASGRRAKFTLYEPIPEWLTGVGLTILDVTS